MLYLKKDSLKIKKISETVRQIRRKKLIFPLEVGNPGNQWPVSFV